MAAPTAKEKLLTKAERYALFLYRHGKEKSRALPVRAYRDPANFVEFESAKRHWRDSPKKRTNVDDDG